jgi:hypothetical protein
MTDAAFICYRCWTVLSRAVGIRGTFTKQGAHMTKVDETDAEEVIEAEEDVPLEDDEEEDEDFDDDEDDEVIDAEYVDDDPKVTEDE